MANFQDWAQFDDDLLLGDEDQQLITDEMDSRVNRDYLLFLIDCRSNMTVHISDILKAVLATYKSKALMGTQDQVALMFFGTATSKHARHFEHLYEFHGFHVPTADSIRELQALIDNDHWQTELGSADKDFPLANVLWACADLFGFKRPGIKRMFLITGEDNPHEKSQALRQPAIRRVRDLTEAGVRVEVFGMETKPGVSFDYSKFYKGVLPEEVSEEDMISAFQTFQDATQLAGAVKRKFLKRTLARLNWTVAEDMNIAVRLYSLVTEAKKPRYSYVSARTNESARPETRYLPANDQEKFETAEMKFYYPYGGEKVIFSGEELHRAKTIFEPGLTLLGFKPRSMLKVYYNISHSYFVYPDESAITGSIVAFTALLEKTAELDQIIICRFQSRKTSPKLVALLPQLEEVDEHHAQIRPPGFHIIVLPYADDIRPAQRNPTPIPQEKHKDLMKSVIKRLTLRHYDPDDFANPVLQRHYAVVEALALEQDIPEVEDTTLPALDQFERCQNALTGLKEAFHLDDDVGAPTKKSTTKRSKKDDSSDDDEAPVVKKRAAPQKKPAKKKQESDESEEEEESAISVDEMKAQVESGKLNKLTVRELKLFLSGNCPNLKLGSMKKPQLISAVQDFFSS